jgi:hypothetical protein
VISVSLIKSASRWTISALDYSQKSSMELLDVLDKLVGVHPKRLADYKLNNYILTLDNLLKMIAIHTQITSNIVVVVMEPTGCVKFLKVKANII